MHERIHHIEAHSEKVFQRTEDQERTLNDLVFGGLGQQRIHEWEGDIRAFTEVDKLGINPMGGIELMEKFRQNPKLSGGLVHGKSTDRTLNLRAMTHLKDLKSIEEPFHQIPQEVKDAITQEQSSNGVSSPFDQLMKYVDKVDYFKSVETINKMGLNQALVALQAVIPMYHRNQSSAEGKDGLTVVPLAVYSKGRHLKLGIAIARGKKKADKRQDIRKRDVKRQIERTLKTK